MILSKCVICSSKKSRFITNQETTELLSHLGLRTTLSKVPILGNILFWSATLLSCIKMNEIVNKFLLASDKFIPEMHLKQPGFSYSSCGQFTKKEFKN